MFGSALVALTALPAAFAAISMTAPVASTSWQAGQQQVISWMDDGKAPSLADMGVCMVSIYVGSQIQQTQLQLISNNVNVAQTGSIAFTPDPSIGANSNSYFIRIESTTLKDTSNPQFNAEAFSAKFTLTGMSGTFNSTIQAQIDAGNSSGAGSATSAAAGSSTPAASSTSASSAASSKAASSSSSAKSTGSATPTGASSNGAAGILASAGLVGTVASLLGAMLL